MLRHRLPSVAPSAYTALIHGILKEKDQAIIAFRTATTET
jgi:hypothetical protein